MASCAVLPSNAMEEKRFLLKENAVSEEHVRMSSSQIPVSRQVERAHFLVIRISKRRIVQRVV